MLCAAGAQLVRVLRVLPLLLLPRVRAAGGDAPSILCIFTISPHGYPWCELGGQLNGNTFLWYNCSQKGICKCEVLSVRGQGTENCSGEEEILKELTEELNKILLDMTDLHTLKGEMTCHWGADRYTFGIWYFSINGNKVLYYDSRNVKGKPLSDVGQLLEELLENDKHLIEYLQKTPAEMCKMWYENVGNHPDNVLNTTAPVSSNSTTESSSTKTPATDQSKNMKIGYIILGIFLSIVISSSVIFGFWKCRKRLCRQLARQQPRGEDCVGQDEEANILQIPEIPGEPSCRRSPDSQLLADSNESTTEGL